MEYSMQQQAVAPQNPNTQPVVVDNPKNNNSHHLYATQYYSHPHSLKPNPNPNPNPQVPIDHPLKTHGTQYSIGLDGGLTQTGIDPYASGSGSSLAHSHGDGGLPVAVAVTSGYYQDPNVVVTAVQNWAAELLRHYGSTPYATGVTIPPNGTKQVLAAHASSQLWTNAIVEPRGNGTWKRGPKKTKIVQSAWCEVCRIECNSKDVLDQHKLGKKHKKKLEKLEAATAPPPVASRVSDNLVIGPQENPDKGKAVGMQITRKKAAEPVEDLETKRRKILEGGAATDAVRTCIICNVVCNSELVFNYHLAGQKHAAMMKKHAGVVTTT